MLSPTSNIYRPGLVSLAVRFHLDPDVSTAVYRALLECLTHEEYFHALCEIHDLKDQRGAIRAYYGIANRQEVI